ncbi:unnamed protein product [Closterium sp. NIES-53]
MYLMTCTQPDLAYHLSLLACYVAPGRHRKVHCDAAKRVLRYLCITSGMGLVLGGRGSDVLTSHSHAYLANNQTTHRSTQSYESEIYAGGYGYIGAPLADLPGERLGTKHIALRYFLTRELQWHGQLRLAYVPTQANTTVVFTQPFGSGDHQRFCTAVGLVPTLPHLLVS